MTNAEKVRSMTDEELAKLMNEDPFVKYLFPTKYCEVINAGENPGFCDDDCYDCILKWLKEEAKEKEEKPKRIEICIENENEEFEHEGYYDSVDSAIQALQDLKNNYGKNLDVKVNANFIPPPTTGSNVINPVVGTKCPYRKIYHSYSDDDWTTTLKNATRIEEEFQDCLGKDCACWTPIGCGRR